MKLLEGLLAVALPGAEHSALARFLVSLGAAIRTAPLSELEAALGAASFLLSRQGERELAAAGWSRERREAINPGLVSVSVTTFGGDGPLSGWQGSELLAAAMGGTLILTGEPDRPPVKEALEACFFHADMVACAGAMAAHYERGISGRGQHIDVAAQEVALSRTVNSILVWQFERRKLSRVGAALNYGLATVRCIWPLADGWCFHTLMSGRFGAPANQALSDWMDERGVDNPLHGIDWLRYNRSTLPAQTRGLWESAMEGFFRGLTRGEIITEGRRRGINATALNSPGDVLADEHLEAREFWQRQNGLRVPGRFVRLTRGDVGGDSAASVAVGAHDTRAGAGASRPGPLAGVKVLDFSWALVGSITTKVLGDLGADVIKVESRTRPCLSRIDVQVRASRPGNFDDKPWFAHLNSSKRSLSLDMKQAASREVLDPLLDWADVVVENFSPGTMAKLGLDFESLRARRPGLIMVSGSVFGQTGPLAREWGVDGTGAALSGRTYLTGWPDRGPVIPGAVPFGDVIVPYVMAAATAAALQARRETGRGCHIDAAMYEICVQQTFAAVLAAQAGKGPERCGNTDAGIYHQGVYPVAGWDRWIAITCPTREDWLRLVALASLRDVEPAAREGMLAGWTRDQDGGTLATQLQEGGVAAGVVQDIEDLLEHDPQISFRGALVELDHPHLGPFGHVRTPISFSRSRTRPYRPPGIGEHSLEIARDGAGLTEERIIELQAAGVFK